MRRFAIITFFSLCALSAFTQNVYSLQDPVTSKLFNPEKYSAIRGTPFLVDKWITGTVTTPRGVYKSLELKLNVYDNILLFNKEDQTFELQDEVVSFTLMPKAGDSSGYLVYKRGISGADLKPNQYVQVLLEGPVSLYKLDVKQLSEMSEINAGIVKTFANSSKYYISRKNQLQLPKLNKTDVLNALSDRQEKVQAYIDEKKISFKKETDLVAVLKFYNTL